MTATRLLQTGIGAEGAPRAVTGLGSWLELDDGRRVIDAMTSPAPLGHRHPKVLEAVQRTLATAPTIDEGWRSTSRDEAADKLVETAFAGEDWVGAVRFAVTGSEANDLALSLAQALTGRSALATRERAYHGMVGLARDVTVQPQWHGGLQLGTAIRPVPPSAEVRVLPFPRLSAGAGMGMSASEAARQLERADELLDDAAAVIVDYTQGGDYSIPAYQDHLARVARDHGALWIADEVVTGFGKSGRWFNFQWGQARPDIVTLGKPMGGGIVPAAAVVVSKAVLEAMNGATWQNYSAMRAHPTAVAAAQALIEVIDEEDLVPRAARLHDVIAERLAGIAARQSLVARYDGRGLHWWIDLSPTASFPDGRPVAAVVAQHTLDAGVVVATSGESSALLISLALTISEAEIDQVFSALEIGIARTDRAQEQAS
jgi:4-aminobutyrate aminotransferase-like enzyme